MSKTIQKAAPVNSTVISRDGTEIAFEQLGAGPAVILVASALSDRGDARKLGGLLAEHFTVINYDRRGRGASGDAADYAVAREVDDIAALIEHAGGSASLFGSSSGAVLALRTAVAGLNVERLALFEPPFVVEDGDFGPPGDYARQLDALLADDRRSAAATYFMREALGMPAFMVRTMKLLPMWSKSKAMAHTLRYDAAVMGDTQRGRPLDAAFWSRATPPTLVLTGGKSEDGFQNAARAVTDVLPAAERRVLPGLNHGAVMMAPKKLAPVLAQFFRN